MKKILTIGIILFSISIMSGFAQNPVSKPPPPKILTVHICNSRAIYLPQPDYPRADANISGIVNVFTTIDEQGNVKFAKAVSGHLLFRVEAEKAALKAKFKPTIFEGKPIESNCVTVYNFVSSETIKRNKIVKESNVKTIEKKEIFVPKYKSPICKRKN